MDYSDDFRRCLDELDVSGIRRLWKHVQPGLPQLDNDSDTLVALHIARTEAMSISFSKRAYSHRWLLDGGYPSRLPDELRPRAERLYPKVVSAVGVSVNSISEAGRPLAQAVELAMSAAVEECYAEGKTDPAFVKARMEEARLRTLRTG